MLPNLDYRYKTSAATPQGEKKKEEEEAWSMIGLKAIERVNTTWSIEIFMQEQTSNNLQLPASVQPESGPTHTSAALLEMLENDNIAR